VLLRTVDNYQGTLPIQYLHIPLILPLGEEADIIVLSLVRNITEGGSRGGIGFLKVSIYVHCNYRLTYYFSPSIARTSRFRERNTA